jgi:hypothetical protein
MVTNQPHIRIQPNSPGQKFQRLNIIGGIVNDEECQIQLVARAGGFYDLGGESQPGAPARGFTKEVHFDGLR